MEKHTPALSIIIPVYNVEEYLRQCLDSILAQDCPEGFEYEVLLADDGSTDCSGVICDEYADAYGNVRVFHRENGGLSAARNTGIEAAQGEYLQFVDSDDWLEPGALQAIAASLKGEPDVLFVNVNRYLNGECTGKSNYEPSLLSDGYEGFVDGYIRRYALNGQAQCLIVRRAVVEQTGLRFHEGILHEDMEWTPLVICAARSAAVLPEPVYAYRLARAGSIMAGLNEKAMARRQHSCEEAALVLVRAAAHQQTPRSDCLLRAAGLVLSQALKYAEKQSGGALRVLAQTVGSDELLKQAAANMPRRIRLCTRLLGLAGGTRLYRRVWGD